MAVKGQIMVNYGDNIAYLYTSGTGTAGYGTSTWDKAVDNNTGTMYYVLATSCYIQLQFATAKRIGKMGKLATSANKPLNHNLQGSNNGSSWTTIMTGAWTDTEEWQYEEFTNANAYTYYKLNVSSSTGGYLRITEITLYEILPSVKGGIAIGSPMIF